MDAISIAAVLVGGMAVAYAMTSSLSEDLGTQVLDDLASWGFAGEVALAAVGVVILAFVAGIGRRGVALGSLVLVGLLGLSMSTRSNQLTNYPTSAAQGFDRPSLLSIAEADPNVSISEQIPGLMVAGEALGDVVLIVPSQELAGRVRAFTDLNAVAGGVEYQISPEFLEAQRDKRVIGYIGERALIVVGAGDTYYWVESRDAAVVLIAEELFDGVNS